MKDFTDFMGGFGDLETMMLDTDLDMYIVRIYDEEGYAMTKAIIGYTQLQGDVMLHMLDAEGYDSVDELFESLERQGVELRLLSVIMKNGGIDIFPYDQLDDNEDCCCECSGCDDDDDDEPWTCHCGNVNAYEDVFCLKCGCLEGVLEDGCEYKEVIEFTNALKDMADGMKKDLSALGIPIEDPSPADIQKMMQELTNDLKGLAGLSSLLH